MLPRLTFAFLCFFSFYNLRAQVDYTRFVNPFIGTGGHGHTYPGAALPFGMVQLSPDTRLDGWDGCGGYHYSDSILYGFSHTHLSGTGVSDYGDLLLMPFDPNTTPKDSNGELISRFSHTQERAEPGYYAVHMMDGNIDVELTASKHCGMHHYTYQENQPTMVVDLNHRDELISYEIAPVNGTRLVGKRVSKAWAKEQTLYFVIDFSQAFTITGTELNGKRLFLSFNQSNQLYVKVGISAVDIAGAEKNISAEMPNWDFNTTRQQAKDNWNTVLRKIEVFSTDINFLTSYYTALYHSFLNPNLFSDVDGRYRGMDNKIHTTTSEQYTVFSLWDTFRALHPLFTIVQQQKTNAFIQTFLNQYKEGGRLPVWELAGNETDCMIGYHAVSVIVDAFVKGINNFDFNLALEAMISISKEDRLGKKAFHEKGFIPVEEESESVSKALEYAYNDWCIATMAKLLGKTETANEYFRYAQYYKNCFNPENGFMQARLNNSFHVPFDPREVNFNYTEANSWQYSFFVPQDIQHWVEMLGGKQQAAAKLDALFSSSNQTTGRTQADITGLIGQYAHGNEPSHHIAFLYNYVGQPWKTQEKTEEIIRSMYANSPDGLSGNEDCGQMSAWLNMTALGLYQVTPGLAQYTLTVPHLDSACIHLENGKTWWIKCHNRSTNGQNYIQKVVLNGVNWNNAYINHSVLMGGGEIVFTLGNQPSDWATGEESIPYSSIDAPKIATTPYFDSQKTTFEGTKSIQIKSLFLGQKIYYTIDGSQPTAMSPLYRYPIIIDKTTTVRAICVAENGSISPEVKQTYYLIQSDRDVFVQSHYNSQYSAGGNEALIDLQRGGNDFRSGAWQGYQGENFQAVIRLNNPKKLHKVGAEFIQDARSWIWMPRKLTIWTSTDSTHWEQVAVIQNTVPENDYNVNVKEFSQEIPATLAKYIRYEAEQMGIIPDWHLGHGGESFIFIDELIAE